MDRTTGTVQRVRKAGIIGIGLDSGDGHTHITHGDDFFLLGGSEATHELMRAKVAQFEQALADRGQSLYDLTRDELDEIAAQLD